MARKSDTTTDEMIANFAKGEHVDWKGTQLPAERLKEALLDLTAADRPPSLSLVNARVVGPLMLDDFASVGTPLSLQILGCRLEILRGRSSRWRRLIVARSHLSGVDLPFVMVERELLMEQCVGDFWLEMRGARVGGTLSISGCRLASHDRENAAVLDGAVVSGDFRAIDMVTQGCLSASSIEILGNAILNGAQLDGRDLQPSKALDLSRARISGYLHMGPASGRFIARGKVRIDGGTFGSLTVKGAILDGCGEEALVADQIDVAETLDLSGLAASDLPSLEVVGAMRFGSSVIGRQFQLHDALLEASGDAVVLYNCRIGGDVLVGHAPTETIIRGGINAHQCRLEGRLVLDAVELRSPLEALGLRNARIEGEIALHDVATDGPIRLDNTTADGITLTGVRARRETMPPVRPGLPEPYAQPEDTLLDLNFVDLRTDLKLEDTEWINGNIRMIGAKVGAGVQISQVSIVAEGRLALIGQDMRIANGFMLAGTPSVPAVIDGEVTLMAARVDGAVTLNDVAIGSDERPSKLVLHGLSAGSILLNESEVRGELSAGAIRVADAFNVHSSSIYRDGRQACDLRNSEIRGKLQFATTRREEGIACRIEGLVTADGASVGSLSWHGVELGDRSLLQFTNMRVERRIDGENLVCGDKALVDLSGTAVPLLVDHLGGPRDSWGGAWLGLDNFDYGRLANPSGGNGDEPGEMSSRRKKWLARRADPSSARPARHLAGVLREQGLFEASRRILMAAFEAEGNARATNGGIVMSRLFGFLFGYGLSGFRTALTVVAVWLIGAGGSLYLHDSSLLVPSRNDGLPAACTTEFDPTLFALDLMIPLDLGLETRCGVGVGEDADVSPGRAALNGWTIGGDVELAAALLVAYQIAAWIVISLAIATWSGLFRRGGRD